MNNFDLVLQQTTAGPSPAGPRVLIRAERSGETVASLGLWFGTTPKLDGLTTGYIGQFQAACEPLAQLILASALGFLKDRGAQIAIGPIDGSTWRRYRFITRRFNEPTFPMEPDNPDCYVDYWRSAGFTTLATYTSRVTDKLDYSDPRLDAVRQRLSDNRCQITPLESIDQARKKLPEIFALSCESFKSNYLYSPISIQEFCAGYERVLPMVDPRLVLISTRKGELQGYLFALPMPALPGSVPLGKIAPDQPSAGTVVLKTVAIAL